LVGLPPLEALEHYLFCEKKKWQFNKVPSYQIVGQAGHEHHVQLDVVVLQDVLQRALQAELRDQHDLVRFDTGTDETENQFDHYK
jgi:hypothetical protein